MAVRRSRREGELEAGIEVLKDYRGGKLVVAPELEALIQPLSALVNLRQRLQQNRDLEHAGQQIELIGVHLDRRP
jgi:hypothetical protein